MSAPLPDPLALWRWLPIGYAITVALEAPVLLAGLGAATSRAGAPPERQGARRYTVRQRLAAALWLTAVTYPIVVVALPLLLWPHVSYTAYVIVAETFAITAECLLFRWIWRGTGRDLVVVGLANALSAAAGLLFVYGLP